ncbi:MAG: hypothetical protein WKF66_20090 [Pedobacter sp.]
MNSILSSWKAVFGLCLVILLMESCSGQAKDQEIKADITIKAKDDVNFAGVQFYVKDATVKLVGTCPTPKSIALVKQKLSTIHVIDSVEDYLTIAPVRLGSSLAMKQQADSILSKYPTVISSVSDTSITLLGDIGNSELQKLLPVMKKVHPNVITLRLNTNALTL